MNPTLPLAWRAGSGCPIPPIGAITARRISFKVCSSAARRDVRPRDTSALASVVRGDHRRSVGVPVAAIQFKGLKALSSFDGGVEGHASRAPRMNARKLKLTQVRTLCPARADSGAQWGQSRYQARPVESQLRSMVLRRNKLLAKRPAKSESTSTANDLRKYVLYPLM